MRRGRRGRDRSRSPPRRSRDGPPQSLAFNLLIPAFAVGPLIGSGGANVKSIIDDCNVRMNVQAKHLVPPGAQHRGISLDGDWPSMMEAQRRILKIVEDARDQQEALGESSEGGSNKVARVLVPSLWIKRIIGKSGENISRLQRESGCRIKIYQASDGAGKIAAVQMSGESDVSTNTAVRLLKESLGEEFLPSDLPPDDFTGHCHVVTTVPCQVSSSVVGRGGSVVRALEQDTGASIVFEHESDDIRMPTESLRVVTLDGPSSAVKAAYAAITATVHGALQRSKQERAKNRSSGSVTVPLSVPEELVWAVAGPESRALHEIEQRTNTKITLDSASAPGPRGGGGGDRLLEINGAPKDVQVAQQSLVMSLHAEAERGPPPRRDEYHGNQNYRSGAGSGYRMAQGMPQYAQQPQSTMMGPPTGQYQASQQPSMVMQQQYQQPQYQQSQQQPMVMQQRSYGQAPMVQHQQQQQQAYGGPPVQSQPSSMQQHPQQSPMPAIQGGSLNAGAQWQQRQQYAAQRNDASQTAMGRSGYTNGGPGYGNGNGSGNARGDVGGSDRSSGRFSSEERGHSNREPRRGSGGRGGGRAPQDEMVVAVPLHQIGAIIGNRGDHIRSMVQESGARIHIQTREEMEPGQQDRKITITGSVQQVAHAFELVQKTVVESQERYAGGGGGAGRGGGSAAHRDRTGTGGTSAPSLSYTSSGSSQAQQQPVQPQGATQHSSFGLASGQAPPPQQPQQAPFQPGTLPIPQQQHQQQSLQGQPQLSNLSESQIALLTQLAAQLGGAPR